MGRLPALAHERNFSWSAFRGCRHSFMFKPPSLFASQVAPTATAKPLGGRGFYVRAERASLPQHAPDTLTVIPIRLGGRVLWGKSQSAPQRSHLEPRRARSERLSH